MTRTPITERDTLLAVAALLRRSERGPTADYLLRVIEHEGAPPLSTTQPTDALALAASLGSAAQVVALVAAMLGDQCARLLAFAATGQPGDAPADGEAPPPTMR